MIARSANARLRHLIVDAMGELGDVERGDRAVAHSYVRCPTRVEDLAQKFGISREKLRQIERRAMSRLKYEVAVAGRDRGAVGASGMSDAISLLSALAGLRSGGQSARGEAGLGVRGVVSSGRCTDRSRPRAMPGPTRRR